MKSRLRIACLAAMMSMLFSASAGAVIIDFIKLTQGGHTDPLLEPLGESAWSTLSIPVAAGMQISGHAASSPAAGADDDPNQFAYLDWGRAGLGVCKDAFNVDRAFPGSGSNRCSPSSDDNVTHDEYLDFVFAENVVVDNLWFNNNHDGGFLAGDMVTIADLAYGVSKGYAGDDNGIGSFRVAAGDRLRVAFNNQQFYVSGIEVNAVPVPAAVWLFATALAGLIGCGRLCRNS
jgi:hypothetical protein